MYNTVATNRSLFLLSICKHVIFWINITFRQIVCSYIEIENIFVIYTFIYSLNVLVFAIAFSSWREGKMSIRFHITCHLELLLCQMSNSIFIYRKHIRTHESERNENKYIFTMYRIASINQSLSIIIKSNKYRKAQWRRQQNTSGLESHHMLQIIMMMQNKKKLNNNTKNTLGYQKIGPFKLPLFAVWFFSFCNFLVYVK